MGYALPTTPLVGQQNRRQQVRREREGAVDTGQCEYKGGVCAEILEQDGCWGVSDWCEMGGGTSFSLTLVIL